MFSTPTSRVSIHISLGVVFWAREEIFTALDLVRLVSLNSCLFDCRMSCHLLDFCEVVPGFDFHEGFLVTFFMSHPCLLPSEGSRHPRVWDLHLIFLLPGHSEDHIFLHASFALRDLYESFSLCGLLPVSYTHLTLPTKRIV